jgi:HlyD family type I secretion membrane fusion protein
MPLPEFLQRLGGRGPSAIESVQSFDSPTAEVLAQRHPLTSRGTLYVLVAMLVLVGIFITVVKLDIIVVGTGRLVPIEGALTVQPKETQIISRVLVRVGDVVKKGQVLAVCDPTYAQADRATIEQQVADYDAQVRRMEAEEKGRPFTPQPDKHFDALQGQIFIQRQTEYHAGVANFDEQISALESTVMKLRKEIGQYTTSLKIAADKEEMYRKLVKDAFVSQLQYLTAQSEVVTVTGELESAKSGLETNLHQLAALKEQRRVYIEKWRDDNLLALVSVRSQLETARQGLVKADKTSELVNLVSPADAVVTRVPILSSGGVATGALPLFDLVPIDAPLEAEVQISAIDIGFIKVGDPVNLKFDAFEFLEHGIGIGVVKAISQDAFTDINTQNTVTQGGGYRQTGTGMYDARIKIVDLKLHDIPAHARLVAGMSLNADVKVGQRTILWYLLGGAIRSGADAMREPS